MMDTVHSPCHRRHRNWTFAALLTIIALFRYLLLHSRATGEVFDNRSQHCRCVHHEAYIMFPSLIMRNAVRSSVDVANPIWFVFTARCTLVQSAVLRSHVVCLSVCLSVTLVNCDHIGWNSSKIISSLVSLGCSLFATPTWRVCSKRNTSKFGPKVTHPLLIWASEAFNRKLRPNGYR